MTFERLKPNITFPNASMTVANKCVFFILRVADYSFPTTWIHHTILLNKYISVLILRYSSIESYSL